MISFARVGILVLLGGIAASSFSLQLDTSPIIDLDRSAKRKSLVSAEDARPAALSDAEIVETHARPLFNAARRPFVARAIAAIENTDNQMSEQPAETAIVPKRLRLLGVNLHEKSFAVLIQNRETEEVRWLKKGDSFDGWILKSASNEQAQFSCLEQKSADCSYDVELYVARQPAQDQ